MDKAVELTTAAIRGGHNILVFADNDTDGITGAVSVFKYLQTIYSDEIGRAHV